MMTKSRVAVGFVVLAFSLLAVAPVHAVTNTTKCEMNFTLTEWAAGVKIGHGSGTITCDNGQTARVKLDAKGGGLTAGKNVVRDGYGKFSEVSDIGEVFGDYASAGASAGAGKSAEAQALTKGPVSLALAAKGTGVQLGISVEKFTISRAE